MRAAPGPTGTNSVQDDAFVTHCPATALGMASVSSSESRGAIRCGDARVIIMPPFERFGSGVEPRLRMATPSFGPIRGCCWVSRSNARVQLRGGRVGAMDLAGALRRHVSCNDSLG